MSTATRKRVYITGGSSGIGLALACFYAERGDDVILLARGSGQVAFISSSAGLLGIYGYSAYAASKFAVTGFVQALRQELAGSGVSAHWSAHPRWTRP